MSRPGRLASFALVPALLAALLAGRSSVAGGQGILLRLNPRVGDTLHTRLEQQTEVTGTRNGGPPMKAVTTSVVLSSRTIVHQALQASTVVVTIVDSADIHSSDPRAAQQVADAEHSMRGQRLIMRLASDGTVESARDARGGTMSGELARSMSSMPAVFPQQPVSVGDQWMREMPLPSGGPLGTRGAGKVIAAFRLDSVSRSGAIAYVSMQGEIRPDAASPGLQLSGGVQGSMQIDRARGWLTDSRFSITMRSLVTPAPATGLAPMRFVTRVVQRLSTMDKR